MEIWTFKIREECVYIKTPYWDYYLIHSWKIITMYKETTSKPEGLSTYRLMMS